MVAPIPVTDPANLAEAQSRMKAAWSRQTERARQLAESMAARRATAEAAEAESRAREMAAEAARQAAIQAALDEETRATPAAFPPSAMEASPLGIIGQTAKAFGVQRRDVVGHSRKALLVRARFAAIHAVKQSHPHLSLLKLGRLFGGRDHTSILTALRKVERDGVPQPDGTNLKAGGGAA
jgi:chromosomal replication initiation ATPase DnaA